MTPTLENLSAIIAFIGLGLSIALLLLTERRFHEQTTHIRAVHMVTAVMLLFVWVGPVSGALHSWGLIGDDFWIWGAFVGRGALLLLVAWTLFQLGSHLKYRMDGMDGR